MFEKILSPSPQLLHTCNFWKGGDFMSIEVRDSVIPESVVGLENTSFPESAGRTSTEATEQLPTVALATFRIPSALEIATTIDHNLRKAVEAMDWESGMQVARTGRKIPSAMEIATTVDHVTLASVGSMDGRE